MGKGGKKEQEKKQRKTRDLKWTLWETHLPIQVVITVRDKYAQGIGNAEMMHEFNRVYVDLIQECEKQNQCVDHPGQEGLCVDVQPVPHCGNSE